MGKSGDNQARKMCEEASQLLKGGGPQSGKGEKRDITDMEKERKETGPF
jgi:hypothetical protein